MGGQKFENIVHVSQALLLRGESIFALIVFRFMEFCCFSYDTLYMPALCERVRKLSGACMILMGVLSPTWHENDIFAFRGREVLVVAD